MFKFPRLHQQGWNVSSRTSKLSTRTNIGFTAVVLHSWSTKQTSSGCITSGNWCWNHLMVTLRKKPHNTSLMSPFRGYPINWKRLDLNLALSISCLNTYMALFIFVLTVLHGFGRKFYRFLFVHFHRWANAWLFQVSVPQLFPIFALCLVRKIVPDH